MRKLTFPKSVLLAVLMSLPAQAQETVLTTLVKSAFPDAQVSWAEGTGRDGVETYRDLFILHEGVRTRAGEVSVEVVDGAAVVTASGIVLNLDWDRRFALEIGSVTLQAGPSLISALADPSPLLDLCAEGPGSAGINAERIRLVREVPALTAQGRPVRSESRMGRIEIGKTRQRAGTGCAIDLTLRVADHQLVRSDQSGFSLIRYEGSLTLPGNLQTLASGEVPYLLLEGGYGGGEYRLPGGAAAANGRDGSFAFRVGSLSATPALTAFLRSRQESSEIRFRAVMNALIGSRADLTGTASGVTLRPEDLIPSSRGLGLSRGSLTNLIGDYRFDISLSDGEVSAEASSEVIGLGQARLRARGRFVPLEEGGKPILSGSIAENIPPFLLGEADMTLRDEGLLRAIELITGFPVSVLAAIYIQEGVNEEPEAWRPAMKRGAIDLARFFSLTTQGEGGRISVSVPTDLSLQETLRLLSLRPDLADQLYRVEVGPASD